MNLNINEVTSTIDAIITDLGPDHVGIDGGESTCRYFEGDTPSCIVGHLINRLGVTPGQVYEQQDNECAVADLLRDLRIMADLETQVYLYILQYMQDKGTPWGECKERADQFLTDYEDGRYAGMWHQEIIRSLEGL